MLGLAWTVLLAAALWVWPSAPAFPAPEPAPVAVLYPDVREPYRGVFLNIIHGIEEGLDSPASLHALAEGDDIPALGAQLARERVKAVIALGRIGLMAARKFPGEMPVILKEAWDKNLLVFSSNPEHVKRGALFSLYPDNRGLGRSLAQLTLERLKSPPKPPAVLALKDLLIAVNARTAEHLGLRLTNQARRRFDLVFPSP